MSIAPLQLNTQSLIAPVVFTQETPAVRIKRLTASTQSVRLALAETPLRFSLMASKQKRLLLVNPINA